MQQLGSPCCATAERPKYSNTAQAPQESYDVGKLFVVNSGVEGGMVV